LSDEVFSITYILDVDLEEKKYIESGLTDRQEFWSILLFSK